MDRDVFDLVVIGGGISGIIQAARLSELAKSNGYFDYKVIVCSSFLKDAPSDNLRYAVCVPFTGRRYNVSDNIQFQKLIQQTCSSSWSVSSIRITDRKEFAGRKLVHLPHILTSKWPDLVGQQTDRALILDVKKYLSSLASEISSENQFVSEVKFDNEQVLFEILGNSKNLLAKNVVFACSYNINQIQKFVNFQYDISEGMIAEYTAKGLKSDNVLWHYDHLTLFNVNESIFVYGLKNEDESLLDLICSLYGIREATLKERWVGKRIHSKVNRFIYQYCIKTDEFIECSEDHSFSHGMSGQIAISGGWARNGFCQVV